MEHLAVGYHQTVQTELAVVAADDVADAYQMFSPQCELDHDLDASDCLPAMSGALNAASALRLPPLLCTSGYHHHSDSEVRWQSIASFSGQSRAEQSKTAANICPLREGEGDNRRRNERDSSRSTRERRECTAAETNAQTSRHDHRSCHRL